MRNRWRSFAAVVLLATITSGGISHSHAGEREIIIGNKNFTEQYIIGQMMKQLLEEHGYRVRMRSDLTSMALRAGMESGDIDVCAEYTGTAWMVHLKRKYTPGTDNNALYELVRGEEAKNHFVWLDPIWNHNTYALASWPAFAERHHLSTMSSLARLYQDTDGKIETFVNFEFSTRPDGLAALEEFYGFEVSKVSLRTGAPGASLIGLREHQTDVAMVFGTDAAITKYGWHVYVDDKAFFPPYDLTPYVRKELLDSHPDVADILNRLVATFPGGGKPATPAVVTQSQKVWQRLNAAVDIDKMEPSEVTHDYLVKKGLLRE